MSEGVGMAVDAATLERIKAVKEALEAAVTAALPLADSDVTFREQMGILEQSARSDDPAPLEYLAGFKQLGDMSAVRDEADKDFKYALTVLGVDPNSDYGLSVILSASQTANLVVALARVLGISPEEVWQGYLFRDQATEE
jgi:hypothetical protein